LHLDQIGSLIKLRQKPVSFIKFQGLWQVDIYDCWLNGSAL